LKVTLTKRAQADLRQIGRWIARDNARRARTYVEELLTTCLSLREFPEQWPVVSKGREKTRRAVHGRYCIFYVVRPKRVMVTAIIHGSRLIYPGEVPPAE
jgi:plasmid stabilization system protein ParE